MLQNHIVKYSCFIIAFFMMLMVLSVAKANNQFPEFAISNDTSNSNQNSNTSNINSTINIKRPLTRDILLLQEQINILEALVERQSGISKIADNYEKIGIPFIQPLPERTICEKLPVNVLCLYSYPTMDKNSNIVKDAEIRIQNAQNEAFNQAIEALQIENQKKRDAAPPRLSDSENLSDSQLSIPTQDIEIIEENIFLWSDIQCVRSECSALVVSGSDPSNRMRVSVGDELDQNARIVKITPTRVVAKIDGKEEAISPLAIEGETQPTKRKKKVADVNFDNIMTQQQNPEPSNSGSQVDLLGPTGLF